MGLWFSPAGAARSQDRTLAARRLRRAIVAVPLFMLALWAHRPSFVLGDEKATPSTARLVRTDAARSIPLDKLSPDARRKVLGVLNDVSVFRRMPTQSVDCDAALFDYLVRNPDVVVGIWQAMGITQIKMERIGDDRFRCNDGEGTIARAEFVYRDQNTHVIYAEGLYEGPLFPRPVRGQCVSVLRAVSREESDGRDRVTARLDTFLRVENVGIELMARMFQGWLGRTVDHNFSETMIFAGNVSRAAESNPANMRRLAGRLNNVDQTQRDQFVELTDRVAARMAAVQLAHGSRTAE